MADLEDINGVGASTAEKFADEGFVQVADVAEADAEELADVVGHVGEDDAQDFIKQAQDIVVEEHTGGSSDDTEEEPEAPVETEVEGEGSEEDSTEADTRSSDERVAEEDTSEEPTGSEDGKRVFELRLDLEGETYDYVMAALVDIKVTRSGRSSSMAEASADLLDEVRSLTGEGSVNVEMAEDELNALHAALTQVTTRYRTNGAYEAFEAVDEVLATVEDARQEYLFASGE